MIVSIDGGCPGVKSVKAGSHRRHFAAISAADGRDGVEAIVDFVKNGKKPVSIDTRRAARSPTIPCRAFLRSTLRKARSSAGVDFPRDW